MGESPKREFNEILRTTSTALGIGTVVSVIVGLVLGLVSGDIPNALAGTVIVGMSITAVVAVLLALRTRQPRSD